MFSYILNILSRFTLSLDSFEKIILDRFRLYNSIDQCKECNSEKCECFNSLPHVFMALVALDYPVFTDHFVQGECKLFAACFAEKTSFTKKEILNELLSSLNYFSQKEKMDKLGPIHRNRLKLILNVGEKLLENCVHVFDEAHESGCETFKMKLPFAFLPRLVALREVVVADGKIVVDCGKWVDVLYAIYESFVRFELNLMAACEPLKEVIYESEDDRIRQLIKRLTNVLKGGFNCRAFAKSRKASDVDYLTQYFPPCMANLHQILRRTHRLSYDSRYQYTLFLKDIGLPVDENISFWKTEYTKPCEGSHCVHEWTEKHRRYKYQIEHMYGLIGNRESKSSHTCSKFIGELKTNMDGGCPFRHMTPENLRKSIPAKILELPDVEDIFTYQRLDLPQNACCAYLCCQSTLFSRKMSKSQTGKSIANTHKKRFPVVISPLQYYNLARSITEN